MGIWRVNKMVVYRVCRSEFLNHKGFRMETKRIAEFPDYRTAKNYAMYHESCSNREKYVWNLYAVNKRTGY